MGACKQYGREVTVEEALQIALEDRSLYGTKGGVTLSCGEPLIQADFVLDTCGYAPCSVFERSLAVCAIYLFDLKHTNSQMHQRETGVGNELILSNLEKLAAAGARIQIRIPLIPGYNDAPEHIAVAGEVLQKNGRNA